MPEFDAVIIGAGPNGLSAGITLAKQGRRVLILEAKHTIGGGSRTAELTLPGFRAIMQKQEGVATPQQSLLFAIDFFLCYDGLHSKTQE